jgi:chlorite dismutase
MDFTKIYKELAAQLGDVDFKIWLHSKELQALQKQQAELLATIEQLNNKAVTNGTKAQEPAPEGA